MEQPMPGNPDDRIERELTLPCLFQMPELMMKYGFNHTLNAVPSSGTGTWSWEGSPAVFGNITDPESTVSFSAFMAGDTTRQYKWKEVNVLERCADSAYVNIRFWKTPTTAFDAGNDSNSCFLSRSTWYSMPTSHISEQVNGL
ncbi:MAG: hypothetical protein R2744_07595 [Bacteroidales bacterium]